MNQIDENGMMEVQVGGAIERRPAEIVRKVISNGAGREIFQWQQATPELRENEILFTTIGGQHHIIKSHE